MRLLQSFSNAVVKFFVSRKDSPASFFKTCRPRRLNSVSDKIETFGGVEAGLGTENKVGKRRFVAALVCQYILPALSSVEVIKHSNIADFLIKEIMHICLSSLVEQSPNL